jgi:peptidase A4-like protein
VKVAAALAVTIAALAGAGRAAAADIVTQTSSNWAGYAIASADPAAPAAFSSVSGSWTQPAATCTRGSAGYSAFWVGLGGFDDTSQALEQIGTEANCSAAGRATYDVWYELVPAGSVTVKMVVRPGDAISATVGVSGSTVSIQIANATRHTVFSKTLTMPVTPDVSSAEWIAEAPSTCGNYGCTPLPLANFAKASFTSGTATTADGHTGTISDPAWAATAVALQGTTAGRSRFAASLTVANAIPGALSGDGTAFDIAWQQTVVARSRSGR